MQMADRSVRKNRRAAVMIDLNWLSKEAEALIKKAECSFLRRVDGYQRHGVRFNVKGPRLWVEGSDVWIEIAESVCAYPDQALFQLGHEVIHSLSPSHTNDASLLEEGLAVWFSLHGPSYQNAGYKSIATSYIETDKEAESYREALHLYNEAQLYTSSECVKAIRSEDINLQNLTLSSLQKACPKIPSPLAERLCKRVRLRA
ncbi:hypothetical protein SAMN05216374_0989 [Tardiphaga sp. OK246]|uniref:hypothetical protein n=1 Tax=Tardiphaga sp. OK246 TaxID=1855307 RepID=UPI000B6CA7F5|nr:hypothetical protein [Tardiphaga sp. OK246]SNS36476.1 hypothetical protein SAMN05216374_0989 [Tardiphaga sp. OK246]